MKESGESDEWLTHAAKMWILAIVGGFAPAIYIGLSGASSEEFRAAAKNIKDPVFTTHYLVAATVFVVVICLIVIAVLPVDRFGELEEGEKE